MPSVLRVVASVACCSALLSTVPWSARADGLSSGANMLQVFVELKGAPVVRSGAAGKTQQQRVVAEQERFLVAMKRAGVTATIIYRVQHARNGFALMVPAAQLPVLRALPGVKNVQRLEQEGLHSSRVVPRNGSHPYASRVNT